MPSAGQIPANVDDGPERSLRWHRRRAELTQQDLADEADISKETVRNVEAGRRPSSPTRAALARALGMHVTAIEWPS